jgi:lipopolysaccharide transport system ATP-binding protein
MIDHLPPERIGDPLISRVIRINGLSKRFRVFSRPVDRLLDAIRPRPGRGTEFQALSDISFEVGKGECFGIIGANGSGKSTLLKLITGTLLPTAGSISVEGRVLALLELGGGINPELTGRENVLASAGLLGFPQDYAASKLQEIEAFADIGAFFDRPMRIYSSGMYVRVAFSIYLFLDPDVLIVDEALSVGDVFFQQKCFDAMQKIMARGTTVLFVSHDTGAIQKLCHRAMVLERGRITFIGGPDEAVNRYHSSIGQRQAADMPAAGPELSPAEAITMGNIVGAESLPPDSPVALIGARIVDADGKPITVAAMGQATVFEILIEAREAVAAPDVALSIHDRFGQIVFGTTAAGRGAAIGPLRQGQRAIIRLSLDCRIFSGHYTWRIGLADAPGGPWRETGMLGPLMIQSDRHTALFYGIVGLPCRSVDAGPVTGGTTP